MCESLSLRSDSIIHLTSLISQYMYPGSLPTPLLETARAFSWQSLLLDITAP